MADADMAEQGADGVAPCCLGGGWKETDSKSQFESPPGAACWVWLQLPRLLDAEVDQHHQVLEEGPLSLVRVFVHVADAAYGELAYAGRRPVCQ